MPLCPVCWKNDIIEEVILGEGGLTCPRCGWANPKKGQRKKEAKE